MSQKAYCDYHMPQVWIGLSHAEIWHCLALKKGGLRVDNNTSYGFHGHWLDSLLRLFAFWKYITQSHMIFLVNAVLSTFKMCFSSAFGGRCCTKLMRWMLKGRSLGLG